MLIKNDASTTTEISSEVLASREPCDYHFTMPKRQPARKTDNDNAATESDNAAAEPSNQIEKATVALIFKLNALIFESVGLSNAALVASRDLSNKVNMDPPPPQLPPEFMQSFKEQERANNLASCAHFLGEALRALGRPTSVPETKD